jgi:phosphoadenosine phosphosulfate reductase
VDVKRGRFYPVANWNKKDILAYIKIHKLRIGRDSRAMGYSYPGIEQEALTGLKHHFPEDYGRVISWFPMAEAAVFRQENLREYVWKK